MTPGLGRGPAIDDEDLSRDESRLVGGQVQRQGADVVGLAESRNALLSDERGLALRVKDN